jgi:predicted nucleic acid-binding protein
MVILDTNIIIDHLRQKDNGESLLMKVAQRTVKENLGLSVISVQELYEGRSTKNRQQEEYLLATITPLNLLPYTYEVAEMAGKIARDIAAPVGLADAAIAATAIVNGASLLTLNKKHFIGIKDLEFAVVN